MRYFKLYPTVTVITSEKNSCLYDFANGMMISIDRKYSELIDRCKKFMSIDDTKENHEFLDKVRDLGLGYYTDEVLFDEEFVNTRYDVKTSIAPINNSLNKVFIELGSMCNLNCVFCKDDNVLFRKTGCKKWAHYEKRLNIDNWKYVLQDSIKLNAQELCFIGGNPMLRFDYIKNIIDIAKEVGFKKFTIYTNGTCITNEVIDFLEQNNVMLNIQILSFNELVMDSIGLSVANLNEIRFTLEKLSKSKVKVVANVLITRFNENEIPDVVNTLKDSFNFKHINIDYIYNKTNNEFYSPKYKDNMYNKTNLFGRVTVDKFNYLQSYNSCLKNQIVIREDGEVQICPMMRISFGNVLDKRIYEIIKGAEYKEYEGLSRNKIDKCSSCSYRYNCLDCRAIEYSATNDLHGLEYCNLGD